MILPATGSAQAEAMCFFEYISINHLNEYQPCDSWRKSLMFFSQTVPAARHAATALALVHRNYYVDRDSNNHVHQPQFSKDWPQDKTVLIHYNLAIQLLLRLESDDSTEKTAVTLLVCYLFICLEHLMGNDVQAVKHLHGGVELSRNIDKSILNNDSIYDDAQPSGPRMLICQVAKQIRRLDMQTVMFLVDWTPAYMQETFMSHHRPSPGSAFRSLDQAADHLQILIARVMRLCWTEKQSSPIGEEPPLPSSHKDIVLGELKIWSVDFENMLERGSSSSNETGSSETHDRLVSLLRLQHTIAGSLLAGYGHGREMEYDNFLPQFEQAVTLAGDVVANSTHELYLGSLNPTFTPEIRILPVLYIIGVKCRHPTVRREVLRILRRRPIREAVWDSFTAARVIERVIEIEEGGSGKGQIASMEQIPVWQRIEAIAWVQSPGKLDLTYTFCARQGTHRETLVT